MPPVTNPISSHAYYARRIALSVGLCVFGACSLAASSAMDDWKHNGSKIYYDAGEVGIGKSNPGRALDIKDNGRHSIRVANTGAGTASAIYGSAKGSTARGVEGFAKSRSGANYGVFGRSRSNDGFGVYGTSPGIGVQGESDAATGGVGVLGFASAGDGDSVGVFGVTNSDDGFAARFLGGTTFFDRSSVGIGTDSPEALLEIETDIAVRMMQINADWPAADAQTIVRWIMHQNSVDSSAFLKMNRGGDVKFNFLANGDAACDGAFMGGGADYAEYFPPVDAQEVFEPGDVVGVFDGRISHRTEGAQKIFVISTNPVLIGNTNAEGEGEGEVVALLGQAPVRIAGPARSGDIVVASGMNDGLAVAIAPDAIEPSHLRRVIGTAWETAESHGVNRVNTAIGVDQTAAVACLVDRLFNESAEKSREIDDLRTRLDAIETMLNSR